MKLLEQFIKIEVDEGKKLNLALATSLAATTPFLKDASSAANLDRERAKMHVSSQQQDQSPRQNRLTKQTLATDSVPVRTSTETYTKDELYSFVQDASSAVGISPAFVDAIIRTETNYHYKVDDPKATSPAGAQGIMQFMPATARSVGLDDPYDPRKAIPAGARHLKQLLDRYDGDYELAAAAYNAGPGNVDKYGGIPPFPETQAYVPRVMELMAQSQFAQE